MLLIFNSKIYVQMNGVSMSSPLGQTLDNFMFSWKITESMSVLMNSSRFITNDMWITFSLFFDKVTNFFKQSELQTSQYEAYIWNRSQQLISSFRNNVSFSDNGLETSILGNRLLLNCALKYRIVFHRPISVILYEYMYAEHIVFVVINWRTFFDWEITFN